MLIDEKISSLRLQIMGLATIGVVLVHSPDIVVWKPMIRKLLSYGGIGVYVFVFLSAVGLYNSLKTRGGGGRQAKLGFYKKRFTRLILPYTLIAMTCYGILDLVAENDWRAFFYHFSTISFWIEHEGAWYVAMLIPVYLVFPWFYDWAEKKNRKWNTFSVLAVMTVLGLVVSVLFPKLHNHLVQVIDSYIIYLIGYYYAGEEKKSNKNAIVLSGICMLLYVVKRIPYVENSEFVGSLTWSMLGIPFVFIAAIVLVALNCKALNKALGFLGKYSLEMYLWNTFLIQCFKTFGLSHYFQRMGDIHGYFSYAVIVVAGCLLSVIYGKLAVTAASIF